MAQLVAMGGLVSGPTHLDRLDKQGLCRSFGNQLSAIDHEIHANNKRFEIFKVGSVEALSNPDSFLTFREHLQMFLWFVGAAFLVDDSNGTFFFFYEK